MEEIRMTIKIDVARDKDLTDFSKELLKNFYCKDHEKSPQEAFARAAQCYSGGDKVFAQKLYDYVSKGWFMFSSPVLSNAVSGKEKMKSLSISCYLCHIADNLEGLIAHSAELKWLSVKGGGIGGHWGDVRSLSDKAPGPIPFLRTVDSDIMAYRQGKTRKGSYAAYLDVSHPDIEEFINIRTPSGDINRKCLNMHIAVNITDKFMRAVERDDDWNLIDPDDKRVRQTLKARRLWEQMLETRFRTGEPYFCFIDTMNRAMPKEQKDLGLKLRGSNLCSEITTVANEERTGVCCLSSLNLERYDEWKDTDIVKDVIKFLDNVLQTFIDNAPDDIAKAKYSAEQERAVGLGTMGWHNLLHRRNISFESEEASKLNTEVFRFIHEQATEESLRLGKERGEAPDMKGSGHRLSLRTAIAPNANSSIILNTSPSIEPERGCAFVHRTRVGSKLVKNKYLLAKLEELGKNTDKIWASIITNNGSVQHLDFLDKHIKNVFKTGMEIDQTFLIEQAAGRQKYICQSQSLNLFFPTKSDKEYVSRVHYLAWKLKCKTLYYLRTESSSKAEIVFNKIEEKEMANGDDCEACSG